MAPAVNRSPDMAARQTNNLTSDQDLLSSLSSPLSWLEIFLSKTLNIINNEPTFYLKGASWTPLGTVVTISIVVVALLFCIFYWLG